MARVTVLGQSGTGKSYYAGSILEEAVPKFDHAVHFDPEDEETGLSDADHDPLYTTVYADKQRYTGLDWLKVLYKHRKIRVVPEGLTTDEMQDLFAILCHAAMVLCKDIDDTASCFVSVDEGHNIISKHSLDDRIERLITGGRKHGVEFLCISQRAQLLHETAITQADRRVYFRISGDNDIRKIDKMCGFNADILEDLPDRHAILENQSSGDWTEIDTNTAVNRQRPHHSADDGIVDGVFDV